MTVVSGRLNELADRGGCHTPDRNAVVIPSATAVYGAAVACPGGFLSLKKAPPRTSANVSQRLFKASQNRAYQWRSLPIIDFANTLQPGTQEVHASLVQGCLYFGLRTHRHCNRTPV